MSYASFSSGRLGYKADGVTPDLNSPFCPEHELKRLNKERLARDEEYMKGLAMSRQNSDASNSSKMSGTSGGKESGYTSAITTPEGAQEEPPHQPASANTGLRRGRPRKNMLNPRCDTPQQGLNPALKIEELQGMQNPAAFLAQQQ